MPQLRQPIIAIIGHVDHGKSSILEQLRGISITKHEAGGITQSIRCYELPQQQINERCGTLLRLFKTDLKIPGLLFLDTPGHAAFNNMRRRGGNLADIAILVIDINENVMEQTKECIEILKEYRTPFVIALNKIDTLQGFRSLGMPLLQLLQNLPQHTTEILETKLYKVVEKLAELGINSERFDRIEDFTKTAAIIPVSAKTKDGLAELLAVVTGLSQRYLEAKLHISVSGAGRATILEVQEEAGLGTTLNIILYDGTIKVNDKIVVGTLSRPVVAKVRALFAFDARTNRLMPVDQATAARGLKVIAPKVEGAVGGMPLLTALEEKEAINEISKEVKEVVMEYDKEGVILKADTLGSLEALVFLLRNHGIPVKRGSIGEVTKKDLAEALSAPEEIHRTIISFNVKSPCTISGVKMLEGEVIYHLIEQYNSWKHDLQQNIIKQHLMQLTKPSLMRIMRGCIFRQSNPAVFGIRLEAGTLKTNTFLIKSDGSKAGTIKSIQKEGEDVNEISAPAEVAVSLPDATVGRQVREDQILLADIPEHEFRQLKEWKKFLNGQEVELLRQIAEIKRKTNPSWGL